MPLILPPGQNPIRAPRAGPISRYTYKRLDVGLRAARKCGARSLHAMLEVSETHGANEPGYVEVGHRRPFESEGVYRFSRSRARIVERPEVDWDAARHPDYREFLNVAKQLGVRLIVFHHREFTATVIDSTLEELQESAYEFEDQREIERKLRDLRVYEGFTCALELSFDYENLTYIL